MVIKLYEILCSVDGDLCLPWNMLGERMKRFTVKEVIRFLIVTRDTYYKNVLVQVSSALYYMIHYVYCTIREKKTVG
jgi:hypothetical protein